MLDHERDSREENKKNIWQQIKYALGFYKNPPYIEDRLREADVRSSLYLTATVIGMEIWLLIRYVLKYVVTGKCATFGIFLKYTYGYWTLLFASLVILIYSILYMRGKLKYLNRFSRPIIFTYFLIGIYFGITTSLNDFSKGRMITCFLAMSLYVTFIFVVRPYISLLLLSVSGIGFLLILKNFAFDREGNPVIMESGDLVNYITFFISITVLYMTIYYQRYSDAQKAYRLEMAAITDDLTGVPNIHRLEQESGAYIQKLLEDGKEALYLVFDIRNLKTYNDRFGYDSGDRLLRQMAKIVGRVFEGEPYARHSADIFMVLTSVDDYQEKARKVRDAFVKAYASETYLDVAVGACRASNADVGPRYAKDCADYAMKLKQNSEGFYVAEYDDKCRQNYVLRNHILNYLDIAVREGYIKAYYQPVMSAADGSLCGCEALARWIDPETGFLSPGQFIPVLEESRQIHKLDRCVYENVFRRMRESLDAGLPVLPTSLNFSRLDFELMDAVSELEKLISKYNIPKEYIHVEITESALTENEEGLHRAVNALHEKGYAIWLDDFGSGYSSMNVLKDFRFDVLKIDMVFLKGFHGNKNARLIIQSIINLARALEMETLTEGVETEEAVEFLKEAGCDRLQGYYYGKPQTYEEILEKIQNGTYKLSPSLA